MAAVMGLLEERRLLRAIRSGSREACEELVRRHYGRIYGFLLHLSGEVSAAEDLTQETFAAAWGAMAKFGGRARVGTWLHRIAYGKFVDMKRRMKRGRAAMEEVVKRGGGAGDVRWPMDEVIANERRRRVYEAVGELEGADREVIVLHYFQGLSFRQMGAVLDEAVGTVKWRTSRALGRLKVSLDGRV